MTGRRETTTLIVGAGPAGLAAAQSLKARGRDYLLVDRGDQVGSSWHRHYRRLHLHTIKEQSHLPDRAMPRDWPRYPGREQVVAYLEDYARHFSIETRFGHEIARIEPHAGAWRARLKNGECLSAATVVIATGLNRVGLIPDLPGLPQSSIRVMHSQAYRSAEGFAGQRVLVVGMGNTGAEIALDLCEAGAQTALSVRGPVNVVYRDTLGQPVQRTSILLGRLPPALADSVGRFLQTLTVGSLSRWGLERPDLSPVMQLRLQGKTPVIDVGTVARIKRGDIDVLPGIRRFDGEQVEFSDGRRRRYDLLIFATGYQAQLASLVPAAAPVLDERGLPRAPWCASLAGLYFLGFDAYDAGGLLRSIRRDAVSIAEHIVSRQKQREQI